MTALVNKNSPRDQHDWPVPPAAIAAFHRRYEHIVGRAHDTVGRVLTSIARTQGCAT